jgi:hydrogenase maturation factor
VSTADRPRCDGEVCVTCADEAVPVRVRELLDDALARVDTSAGIEEVSVALVDAVVGDVVLVHGGEAIACLGAAAPGPPGAG